MVDDGAVIFSGEPLPTYVPPQLPEYHFNVPPEPPVAVRLTPAPAQAELGLAEAVDGATGAGSTVTITLAQLVVLQVPSART